MSLLALPGRGRFWGANKETPTQSKLPATTPENHSAPVDLSDSFEVDPELLRAAITADYQRLASFENDEPLEGTLLPNVARDVLGQYRFERDEYRTQLERYNAFVAEVDAFITTLQQSIITQKTDLDNSLALAEAKISEINDMWETLLKYEQEHVMATNELAAARQKEDAIIDELREASEQRLASLANLAAQQEISRHLIKDTASEYLGPIVDVAKNELASRYEDTISERMGTFDPEHLQLSRQTKELAAQKQTISQDVAMRIVQADKARHELRCTTESYLSYMQTLQQEHGQRFNLDFVVGEDGAVDVDATVEKFNRALEKIKETCDNNCATFTAYEANCHTTLEALTTLKDRTTLEGQHIDKRLAAPLYTNNIPLELNAFLQHVLALELLNVDKTNLSQQREALGEAVVTKQSEIAQHEVQAKSVQSLIAQIESARTDIKNRLALLKEQFTDATTALETKESKAAAELTTDHDRQLNNTISEARHKLIRFPNGIPKYIATVIEEDYAPYRERLYAAQSADYQKIVDEFKGMFGDKLRERSIFTDHNLGTQRMHIKSTRAELERLAGIMDSWREYRGQINERHQAAYAKHTDAYDTRRRELAEIYQTEHTALTTNDAQLADSLAQAQSKLARTQAQIARLDTDIAAIINELLPNIDQQIDEIKTTSKSEGEAAREAFDRTVRLFAELTAATALLNNCLDGHDEIIAPYRSHVAQSKEA